MKEKLKKVNFVLDLDLTLICAEALEEYDKIKYKDKAKKFKYENMEDYYIIFQWPFLQEFLTYIFTHFNVSDWTAASKDYALFIIDKIIIKNKIERKIHWIFFNYHCDRSKKNKNGTKDLSMLWDFYKIKTFTKYNTIILDDYSEVYKTQPNNTIIAKEFQFYDKNSNKDSFLQKLIIELDNIKNGFNKNSIKNINTILRS